MNVYALKADYYDKFKCIGRECQISCCNYNWNVSIDKNTYQKYKKFSSLGKSVNSDYARKVRTSIELNPKSTNSTNYGRLIQIKDERAFILGNDAYKATECVCPFTTNDNLCDLHSKFGHDMLSFTCQTFPRNLNFVFEDYEQSLSTECEAVCELLYDIKEPLRFRKNKVVIDSKLPVNKTITKDMIYQNPILKYFTIIRATCLKILQSREFTMDNRIILLGLFLSKVSSLKGKNLERTPTYAKSFLNSQQEYLEYFDIKVKKETTPQKGIKDIILKTDDQPKKEKLEKHLYPHKLLLDSINFETIELGYIEKNILIRIKNNLVLYYNNYSILSNRAEVLLKDQSHYLENVMANLLIGKIFPFISDFDTSNSAFKKIDLMDNYIIFTWAYVTLKVMLTSSITITDKLELNLDLLFKTTVLHNREIISSNNILTEMCKILKVLGYTSVSQLAILINNS